MTQKYFIGKCGGSKCTFRNFKPWEYDYCCGLTGSRCVDTSGCPHGKTADDKWVYGFLLKNIDGKCAILDEDNTVNFNYLSYSIVNPVNFNYLSYSIVNPETVGQWTGIKDKHGKDIYEGDIVRVKTRHGTIVSSICYFDDFSMFAVKEVALYYRQYPTNRPLGSSGSSTSYRPYNWNSYFWVEVIGNIHDNPELLKDK